MARNADLRKLLQTKLGVEQAQLYKIAGEVADSLSIPVADAILVLAAKKQINLHKHGGNLTPGKLEEIRRLLPYLPATASPVHAAPSNGKRSAPKPKKAFKVKLEKAEDDPILDKT